MVSANTTCPKTGKTGYSSESHAKSARKSHKDRLRTYRCDACGKWHLSNPEKRTNRNCNEW